MRTSLHNIQKKNGSEFATSAAHLAIVVEELLKEEWETAKLEASGPLRQIPIRWKKFVRKKARKQRREKWLTADDRKEQLAVSETDGGAN